MGRERASGAALKGFEAALKDDETLSGKPGFKEHYCVPRA